jgi:hypothetical protein
VFKEVIGVHTTEQTPALVESKFDDIANIG